MSNAERQARHRQRLKESADKTLAYEVEILQKQNEQIAAALNDVRKHVGLSEIQLVKSAYRGK